MLAALVVACSNGTSVVGGDAAKPPADAASDIASDTSLDVASDVASDVAPDAPVDAPDVLAPDVVTDGGAVDAEPDAADASPDVPVDVPPSCTPTETRCGDRCVDVQTDPSHCGACGNTCGATTTCRGGMCVPTCGATETLCGTPPRCVDLQTDGDHCGACGTSCPSGQVCGAGRCARTCTAPAVACTSDGGVMDCADLQTDRANCGRCGNACPSAQVCVAGACVTPRAECPTGQTDCAPTEPAPMCVDTMTSTTHCGRCGGACAMGQVCTAGTCITPRPMCPAGQTDCAPTAPAPTCIDTQASEAHCGRCGNACPAGQVCASGTCACPTGTTLCGSACVNTQSDRANCGACNNACPTGQVCNAGVCRVECTAPSTACTATGGAMSCVNTQSDRANCGMCNNACPAAQSCTSGACVCPSGQTLCGADCVDTQTSTAHCGACNAACVGGQTCRAGRCENTACPQPAPCTGAACLGCSRVAFREDWESGIGAWHDPSMRGPITVASDTSACRSNYVRETVRVGGGRIYSRAGTPVTAGRTYCATAWIRGSAGTWPFVGIRASDAGGAIGNEHWLIGQPCFSTGISSTVSPVTSDGAWRWYSREFVMPAYTHVVMELEIWDGGAVGTADFDEVQLIEGPCPTAPTTVCAAATCPTCPTGQTSCGGACVDLRTSDAHCGRCGNACDASMGLACSRGTCVPNAGLVAWYPLDGNGANAVSGGAAATVTAATAANDRFGTTGGAMAFTRASMSMLVSDNPRLPVGAAARSLSLWMNSTMNYAGNAGALANWGVYVTRQRFGMLVLPNVLYFVGESDDLAGSRSIIDGRWHHVVATYNGTTVVTWLDGTMESTGPKALNTVGTRLVIGNAVLDHYAEFFQGSIDDVRVYDRVLSMAEVNALYQEGAWRP